MRRRHARSSLIYAVVEALGEGIREFPFPSRAGLGKIGYGPGGSPWLSIRGDAMALLMIDGDTNLYYVPMQGAATNRPLPPFPTQHLPGSLGKKIIMEWRWNNKFHIHHPEDAKLNCHDREIGRDFDNYPIHFDREPDIRTLHEKLLDELRGIEWDIESEDE